MPLCDLPSRSMAFHYIESLDELVPGIKGIPEPLPDTPIVKLSEMLGSICLVPGLVFDGAGYRIGYGGGFSTLPALLESRFGMENISQIHGLALSAWAFAGLSGNQITALSLRLTGGYRMMLFVICGLYIVALIVSLRLNKMAAEASEEIIETENAMQKKAA